MFRKENASVAALAEDFSNGYRVGKTHPSTDGDGSHGK